MGGDEGLWGQFHCVCWALFSNPTQKNLSHFSHFSQVLLKASLIRVASTDWSSRSRKNMIFPRSDACACISCYLQIAICWQGLCHDTSLTCLPQVLQRSSLSAAAARPGRLDSFSKHFRLLVWPSHPEKKETKSPRRCYIPGVVKASRPCFPPLLLVPAVWSL